MAVAAQFLPLMASVEDDVVESFRSGGVPYERFRRFHDVMAEGSGQTVVAGLFEHILPLVPGLAEDPYACPDDPTALCRAAADWYSPAPSGRLARAPTGRLATVALLLRIARLGMERFSAA